MSVGVAMIYVAATLRVAAEGAARGVITPGTGSFRPVSSFFLAISPFGRNAAATGERAPL
jgi:hypothetical protein